MRRAADRVGRRFERAPPPYEETAPRTQKRRRGCPTTFLTVVLLMALLGIALFTVWNMVEAMLGPYDGRIYPNVTVLGVDVGGLTTDEASKRLSERLAYHNPGPLTLSHDGMTWQVPWLEAGLRLDIGPTVRRAYDEGRASSSGSVTVLSILTGGRREVAPAYVIEPETVRAVLERLAPEMANPPSDASIHLEGDQFVVIPGQSGWVLDVDDTMSLLIDTITHLGPSYPVVPHFQMIEPRLADTTPALAQAEKMLDCRIDVSTYDVLTDETFTWTLERDIMITWLRVEQVEDGSLPTIAVSEEAVEATVAGMAAGIGEGRGLRVEEAAARILRSFELGGGTVVLDLVHPLRSYIVRSGDTLTEIAIRFGMPPGLIAEVNPGVDPNTLSVGQELAIPSQFELTPHIPVPAKRIVISIPEQQMRVYENDELLYEWPVSTGLTDSPTYAGTFQILSKDELAYASQWDLWMPHFLAVHRVGGDTYNGIHGLPTLSSGRLLWEGVLGSPASFGCIVLGLEEAETLYNWAEIGVMTIVE